MSPVLEVVDLSFAYPQRPATLQNVQFQLYPGQRVGLIGPNGAGKTTLFLCICGVLGASGGKIQLFDRGVKVGEFRPEIGFVFQNPDDQLFCPSVWDDVAFGVENMGLQGQELTQRVQRALATTGVAHLAQRVPHQLSGGEKCMVAIASILAMQPQLILYDEPSANLDLSARRRLIQFLQHSQETLFISSHDLELILEVCDRVILLNHGQVLADGTPTTILGNGDLMQRNGLEVPYSLK